MATRRAIANGNWSATATWNGGVVPGNGDTVYANGFNVTLDQDITIGGANNPIVNTGSLVSGQWYEIVNVGGQNWTSLGAAANTTGTVFQSSGTGTAGNLGTARALATLTTATNTAAGATTGGGVFTMPAVRTMTCDLRAGATTCLNVTATTGTLTLSGIRASGGTATSAHAANNNSTAVIEIAGGSYIGGNATSATALNNASTGTINITSPAIFTGGNVNSPPCLNNASTGTFNISASCSFIGFNGNALNNASTGSVTISGSCTFTGGQLTPALNNASSGSFTISGSCTFTAGSGAAAYAFNNFSTGSVTVTNSTFAASAFSPAFNIANNSADVRLSGDFLDHWSGWKAVNGGKWRLGTTPTAARTRYALAGTTDSYVEMFTADNTGFGLPAATDVRSGISYGGGAVSGTCAVPAASSVAFGVPVDNTTGTAILTGDAVAASVWSAASRTITEGGITAADVWSHATRTITGGTVTTLTNAPTVPSASAIASQVRTELTTELGRIDAAISTRATPANIPTSDITAIKNKTDLLNTTRLAQVSTTEIVGNLLAQANS